MVEEICEKKFWAYLINGVFDNLAYEVIAVFEISKGWLLKIFGLILYIYKMANE